MNRTYEARGTPEYIAPEIRKQSFHVPADIWALGCMILYFTITQLGMSDWTSYVRDEVEKKQRRPDI
jgi:serine/threonine protein kinase